MRLPKLVVEAEASEHIEGQVMQWLPSTVPSRDRLSTGLRSTLGGQVLNESHQSAGSRRVTNLWKELLGSSHDVRIPPIPSIKSDEFLSKAISRRKHQIHRIWIPARVKVVVA